MKNCLLFYLVFLLLIHHAAVNARQLNDAKTGKRIVIKTAINNETLSTEWKNALVTRISREKIDSLGKISRPLSVDEAEWRGLIESRSFLWNSYRDSLALPFRDIFLPDTICVMLGFLGNDDGFTYGKQTVCLDVTALYKTYGKAGLPENGDRIDRIFAHEYTHLLHKQWAVNANYKPLTFKDDILWECFYEGIGMYRSLNNKWLPVRDSLPVVTQSALAEIYPVFVEKILAVHSNSNPSDSEKEKLQAHLSRGPVNKKWGAFPVAVWLMLEVKENKGNLSKWIDKGPDAVIELAKKYLPSDLNKQFLKAL